MNTSTGNPAASAPGGTCIPVEGGLPEPAEAEPFAVTIVDLLHAYGRRWQISAAEGITGFVAVQRPTPTALRVLAGATLEELAAKLGDATDEYGS